MSDVEKIKQLSARFASVHEELAKNIVGQESTIQLLFTSMLADGHCLLVGVPGLAKTLLVRSIGEVLGLSFNRIQFTPDLMPSDITGTEVIQDDTETNRRVFKFVEGPVFSNLVLADEINRTPPKTQAALLEAMQEKQVTAAGKKHKLPDPFFVLATQNPIEQEGTYPLPEAQLDRFMFQINVDYPTESEELDVILSPRDSANNRLNVVLEQRELLEFIEVVKQVPVAEHVAKYALSIVRSSRPQNEDTIEEIKRFVTWGAGPRGGQNLVLAAKAVAALDGRLAVEIEDIHAVCLPVLTHRIKTNFSADAENISSADLIELIVKHASQLHGFKTHGLVPKLLGSKNAQ